MGSKWLRQVHAYTVSTPNHHPLRPRPSSHSSVRYFHAFLLELVGLGHTLRMGVLYSTLFLTWPAKPPSLLRTSYSYVELSMPTSLLIEVNIPIKSDDTENILLLLQNYFWLRYQIRYYSFYIYIAKRLRDCGLFKTGQILWKSVLIPQRK